MIHATIDTNGVCDGYSDLTNLESSDHLIFLPNGWDNDLLWRKWESGQWSSEKFEPVPLPTESTKLELMQKQIDDLTATLGDFMLGGV